MSLCKGTIGCSISHAEQATPAGADFLASHSSWAWILHNLLSLCLALVQPLRHVSKLQGCRRIQKQWWEGSLGTLQQGKRHTKDIEGHLCSMQTSKTHPFQNHNPFSPQYIVWGWCLCCHHHIIALTKKTYENLNSGKACAVDTFKISCHTVTVRCGEGDMQPGDTWWWTHWIQHANYQEGSPGLQWVSLSHIK